MGHQPEVLVPQWQCQGTFHRVVFSVWKDAEPTGVNCSEESARGMPLSQGGLLQKGWCPLSGLHTWPAMHGGGGVMRALRVAKVCIVAAERLAGRCRRRRTAAMLDALCYGFEFPCRMRAKCSGPRGSPCHRPLWELTTPSGGW
jgi:hypothetical protein